MVELVEGRVADHAAGEQAVPPPFPEQPQRLGQLRHLSAGALTLDQDAPIRTAPVGAQAPVPGEKESILVRGPSGQGVVVEPFIEDYVAAQCTQPAGQPAQHGVGNKASLGGIQAHGPDVMSRSGIPAYVRLRSRGPGHPL